jgi:hypothetical protein
VESGNGEHPTMSFQQFTSQADAGIIFFSIQTMMITPQKIKTRGIRS